jgi:ribosomal protein L23
MNTAFVIKKAILSEKAYTQMARSIYSFKVDSRATKKEIASAIKKQFSVEVEKVNIINQSSNKRKITGTRREVEILGGKKAIVYLKIGQTISMLSQKTENKPKTSKGSKDSKEKTSKNKGFLSKITKSNKDAKSKKGDK